MGSAAETLRPCSKLLSDSLPRRDVIRPEIQDYAVLVPGKQIFPQVVRRSIGRWNAGIDLPPLIKPGSLLFAGAVTCDTKLTLNF